MSLRTVVRAALVVAARPRLWAIAVVEFAAFVPKRWWRTRPFLPLPDPALLRFRMVTAYGDPDATFASHDLVTWLEWCRDWRRSVR